MARNSRDVARRPAIDPAEEPSAEWGWHGSFPRGTAVAGWLSIIVVLALLIGNHRGRIEDLWIVGIAAAMALGLVLNSVRKRNSWRR